ncbi:DUF4386 domain-containing protein [Aureisphaera galaxeae]|uniref:DUF4386 domain-containing protein n=1 Tax=Aureisphaera galaxeae TaxID=1538023 RepID=UPI00234FE9D7|nr:DUF4386 domain-containing protein [Aureisphaera galaxeae]MDC8004141.1 DUF4386 domain-containing protein [Aureisphaera galaxeae]
MKKGVSLSRYARIGGFLYLLIIVLGTIGQIAIRGSIITMDAESTYQNLMTSESLWRLGIIGDVMMHALDIPLMVILFMLFRIVNKYIALLGMLFNVIQTAVLVANKMLLIIPTILINNPEYTESFSASQIQALVYLLVDMHDYGFGLGLIFFGFACLTYGYLVYKSDHFPRILGVLVVLAGLCYLINSFVLILAPEYSGDVFYVLLFSFIGELSFALWLLIKGIRIVK